MSGMQYCKITRNTAQHTAFAGVKPVTNATVDSDRLGCPVRTIKEEKISVSYGVGEIIEQGPIITGYLARVSVSLADDRGDCACRTYIAEGPIRE